LNIFPTNPVYAELTAAARTYTTAYRLAFSDPFHGPVIHNVSRRSRCIRIDANDNVHVAKVRVTIFDEVGKALEQGDAARTFGNAWSEFETKAKGTTLVEVWDLAGNVARPERMQGRAARMIGHFFCVSERVPELFLIRSRGIFQIWRCG
jgi:hypothetical protein